ADIKWRSFFIWFWLSSYIITFGDIAFLGELNPILLAGYIPDFVLTRPLGITHKPIQGDFDIWNCLPG
ncbi:unnamed protein product, partial [marine sediment metagenome]